MNHNPDHIVEAEGVEFGYDGTSLILKGVGITIDRGDVVGILGPNGSGKTTFIKCLNRILTPSQGEIVLDGRDLSGMRRSDIARLIGYVPQESPDGGAYPTTYEVVMMGRKPLMSWHFSENDEGAVWKVMEDLDIAHLASHRFDELSSGQVQRVLMARALAQEAQVLLLDEPTSNLDIRYQMDIMDLVCGIVRTRGVSACIIVHDLDLALRYCNKVVLMKDGEIVNSGASKDVITAENIKSVYDVDAFVEDAYGRLRVMMV